ncbi:MAG TPA: isochorismatase family protein [Acidimicrobiales bacterium]|nr:isochorismatase family protein [Acidimicrobiales bacterium]
MPRDIAPLVDPAHTVLLLQECQKGVVGSLSALPEMAEAAQRQMVPNVVRLAAAARRAGVRVIHATAAHQPDMWGANDNARVFHGVLKSPVRLVIGAEAVEVLDEIGVEENDILFFRQHGLSPMQGTELDSLFRNAGVTTIVIAGVSANIAIPNTTFDAVNRSYQVVIPRDAIAGTPDEYTEQVLKHTLGYIATITTTADLVTAWKGD